MSRWCSTTCVLIAYLRLSFHGVSGQDTLCSMQAPVTTLNCTQSKPYRSLLQTRSVTTISSGTVLENQHGYGTRLLEVLARPRRAELGYGALVTIVLVCLLVVLGWFVLRWYSQDAHELEQANSLMLDPDYSTPVARLRSVKSSAAASGGGDVSSDDGAPLPNLKKKERVMEYETHELGSWRAFSFHAGTVWASALLWQVSAGLLLVSIVVACGVFFFTAKPEGIDVTKFDVISRFLKVFVAFLLGYFLVNAVDRWSNTVDGFLQLFDSCRNLVMQLHALGVKREHSTQCARYGMLSAKFLNLDLRLRLVKGDELHKTLRKAFDDLISVGQLSAPEEETLMKVDDHASLIWIWVGLLLGRMAEDGDIPGMASPTYGRLMQEAQSAQAGIRRVRVSVVVQTPFVYVHTLSLLVHTNNILCAVSFGCQLGMSCSKLRDRDRLDKPPELEGTTGQELQSIVMAFITCFVAPLLYQAFLQIGLALSQPFGNELASIPILSMITNLKRDLEHAALMADEVPNFTRPCFNQAQYTLSCAGAVASKT